EQCETGAVADDNVVCLVIRRLRDAREQAGFQFRFRRQDVFDPPRRMQCFHVWSVGVEVTRLKLKILLTPLRTGDRNRGRGGGRERKISVYGTNISQTKSARKTCNPGPRISR